MEMGRFQMNGSVLIDTARQPVGTGKGLLAMDESNPTCNQRFAALGARFAEWRAVIARVPATRARPLARRARQRGESPAGAAAPGCLQPSRAARRGFGPDL